MSAISPVGNDPRPRRDEVVPDHAPVINRFNEALKLDPEAY